MIPDTGRRPAATAPGTAPARRRPPTPWLVGGALLLLAVVGCVLAGVSPVAPSSWPASASSRPARCPAWCTC